MSQKRIKKRAGIVFKTATAAFFVAAAFIIWHDHPADTATAGTREFFTDDDGKTWFIGDGAKIAPFDHDGRQAVLARVYESKNGRQFVGYLMKFSDQTKTRIVEAKTIHPRSSGASAATGPAADGLLIKRPQQKEWVSDSDPGAKDVKTFTAPDGSSDYVPVNP